MKPSRTRAVRFGPVLPVLIGCLSYATPSPAQRTSTWAAPAEADTLANPYEVNEAFIQSGRQTYDVLCWTCHGEWGEGNGPASTGTDVPPADFTQASVQAQSDGALFWKLTTGNPPMAAYEGVLSERERWELVAYIRRLAQPSGDQE